MVVLLQMVHLECFLWIVFLLLDAHALAIFICGTCSELLVNCKRSIYHLMLNLHDWTFWHLYSRCFEMECFCFGLDCLILLCMNKIFCQIIDFHFLVIRLFFPSVMSLLYGDLSIMFSRSLSDVYTRLIVMLVPEDVRFV